MSLISMPFTTPSMPSIALGTLKACLDRAGIASRCRYFNIEFVDYIADAANADGTEPLTYADFDRILRLYVPTVGDWVFCVPPFREDNPAVDERFEAYLRTRDISDEDIAIARRLRQFAASFLAKCAREILADSPKLVAFSTMFSQNVASLTLAKMLKAADPTLRIVFGGANCDGPMGPALHRSFPWIDVVVRGEGERAIVELARDALAGEPFRHVPGLCIRDDAGITHTAAASPIPMDEVPAPDYQEYFAALESSRTLRHVPVTLLFESSRGCWWGEKQHCTFCGLNGSSIKYRSKSPERVYDEVTDLARRYQQLRFWAVDNIIDMDYFRTLLPRIRDAGFDLEIFFETKANLKREHLRMMRDSGITMFQPGIESFSTSILKLMRKGVSGLQNIRLLKWCREYGLDVSYHVLAGFPTESVEEYDRMAEMMPALHHLQPPDRLNMLHIDRFSPLHSTPEELGIEIVGPLDQYRILYPVDDATATEIAYYFTPRYLDGRNPETYIGKCRDAIVAWNAQYRPSAPHSTLHYRRGPGFVIVDDERVPGQLSRFKFTDWQATAFHALDAIATPAMAFAEVQRAGHTDVTLEDVQDFCDALVGEQLAVEEGGRYLTLPVAENPDAGDRARVAPLDVVEPAPGLVALRTRRAVSAAAND